MTTSNQVEAIITTTREYYEQIAALAKRTGEIEAETRILHDIINDAVISTTVPVHVLERIVHIIENKRETDQ